MCRLVQCETGRIVGDVSLVDLIGVVIGGILIEEGLRCRIYVGLIEDCQREILVDQQCGYVGGIMVCDGYIDPVAARRKNAKHGLCCRVIHDVSTLHVQGCVCFESPVIRCRYGCWIFIRCLVVPCSDRT